MSRSKHHGCGQTCGVCRPHKKWKSNSPEDQAAAVRRASQEWLGALSQCTCVHGLPVLEQCSKCDEAFDAEEATQQTGPEHE